MRLAFFSTKVSQNLSSANMYERYAISIIRIPQFREKSTTEREVYNSKKKSTDKLRSTLLVRLLKQKSSTTSPSP